MTTYRHVERVPAGWRVIAIVVDLGLAVFVVALFATSGEPVPLWVWLVSLVPLVTVPALVWVARLEVTVGDTAIDVRWVPLARRFIPFADVASVEATTYRPMREFGGWGIRWGRGGDRAYSIEGDRGVALRLRDGRRVVLGADDPAPLAAAIGARLDGGANG